tara:strand:- start:958 stop:1554 length:597 start_codon:yes stop_codon:yes gene_type:complete
MEIKEISISEIKPAEYNPRMLTEDNHHHLKQSIEKFGFVDPLILNQHEGRENILVGGHQRFRIAKELEMETVPVVYVNLDEEKEKELNIRLNKNTGSWDYDQLANNFDIEFLKDIGFKMSELGFFGDKLDIPNSNDMYTGMPEFDNENEIFKTIYLHFRNQEDVDKFAELIKQNITDKNKSYWYPAAPVELKENTSYD